MPFTVIGPAKVPRSGSSGYERASVVSESGCACSARSYVMNCTPYVIRPPPVVCVGSAGPSVCVRFAFDTRTSSHDESSTALPVTIPVTRGNAG